MSAIATTNPDRPISRSFAPGFSPDEQAEVAVELDQRRPRPAAVLLRGRGGAGHQRDPRDPAAAAHVRRVDPHRGLRRPHDHQPGAHPHHHRGRRHDQPDRAALLHPAAAGAAAALQQHADDRLVLVHGHRRLRLLRLADRRRGLRGHDGARGLAVRGGARLPGRLAQGADRGHGGDHGHRLLDLHGERLDHGLPHRALPARESEGGREPDRVAAGAVLRGLGHGALHRHGAGCLPGDALVARLAAQGGRGRAVDRPDVARAHEPRGRRIDRHDGAALLLPAAHAGAAHLQLQARALQLHHRGHRRLRLLADGDHAGLRRGRPRRRRDDDLRRGARASRPVAHDPAGHRRLDHGHRLLDLRREHLPDAAPGSGARRPGRSLAGALRRRQRLRPAHRHDPGRGPEHAAGARLARTRRRAPAG